MKINKKNIDKLFNISHNKNNEITNQFFLYKISAGRKVSENIMTDNSEINVDNDSSIADSHQLKLTKDQSNSTANTSEALIITENISDKNKIKNNVKNTTSNNQNLDNDIKQVRRNAINVENQLKEV